MLLPTRFWSEMSWTDFDEADMGEVIAVLPVAAIEQHGPHLPVGVDTFVMDGYIAQVVARLPAQLPVLFLPVQSCGCSIEHTDFPGRSQPLSADPHQGLDRARRMRLQDRLPQAGALEFARRQCRNARHHRA